MDKNKKKTHLEETTKHIQQDSHSCDEAKFKGCSRPFSRGHNTNPWFISYTFTGFFKKLKKKSLFFSRAGGQIKAQIQFFKGFQVLIKSVDKSQGFSRNQARVGTLMLLPIACGLSVIVSPHVIHGQAARAVSKTLLVSVLPTPTTLSTILQTQRDIVFILLSTD